MSSSKSEHKRGFSLPRIDVLPYTMVMSSLMPFLTTFCPSPMSTLTIIISITSQSLAHTRNTMIILNGWMNEWEPFLSASPLAWSPTHTFYHLINLYGCCHWEHGGGPHANTPLSWSHARSISCGPRWVEARLPGTGTPFLCKSLSVWRCPPLHQGGPLRPCQAPEEKSPGFCPCREQLSRPRSVWPDYTVSASKSNKLETCACVL